MTIRGFNQLYSVLFTLVHLPFLAHYDCGCLEPSGHVAWPSDISLCHYQPLTMPLIPVMLRHCSPQAGTSGWPDNRVHASRDWPLLAVGIELVARSCTNWCGSVMCVHGDEGDREMAEPQAAQGWGWYWGRQHQHSLDGQSVIVLLLEQYTPICDSQLTLTERTKAAPSDLEYRSDNTSLQSGVICTIYRILTVDIL